MSDLRKFLDQQYAKRQTSEGTTVNNAIETRDELVDLTERSVKVAFNDRPITAMTADLAEALLAHCYDISAVGEADQPEARFHVSGQVTALLGFVISDAAYDGPTHDDPTYVTGYFSPLDGAVRLRRHGDGWAAYLETDKEN